jgi:hypothetical protein
MPLPSYNCILCALDHEETLEHLFLQCPFAISCWLFLQVNCPNSWNQISDVFVDFQQQLHVPFFMEIVVLFCWSIWTVRNKFIFEGIQPTLVAVQQVFKQEFAMVIHQAKSKYFPLIASWVDSPS